MARVGQFLFKELRQRFDKEQQRLHRHLFLSSATGASFSFLENTEMGKVQKYLDTVNLMAYDYYEPTDDATTGSDVSIPLQVGSFLRTNSVTITIH